MKDFKLGNASGKDVKSAPKQSAAMQKPLAKQAENLFCGRDEVSDIASCRTEFSKHFRNANGSVSAIVYDEPIHYFNKQTGSFEDIDNTLVEEDLQSFHGYRVKANKFETRFAKKTDCNCLVSILKENCKIEVLCGDCSSAKKTHRSFKKIDMRAEAKIDYADKKRSFFKSLLKTEKEERALPLKETAAEKRLEKCSVKNSRIMYENFCEGVDLEYIVSSQKIKENIIVNTKSADYEFYFSLKLTNLDMRLSQDKRRVEMISTEPSEERAVAFTIPAPFMYDGNGEISDKVTFEIEEESSGLFSFCVVADSDWINDKNRKLPVVIDPQIISTDTRDIVMNSYNNGVLVPSSDNLNALGRCYGNLFDVRLEIKCPNIVSKIFSDDTRVLNATVELSKASDIRRVGSKGFYVYQDGLVVDHFTYNGYNNRIDVNITNELNAAIKGKIENSVFDIKAIERADSTNDYMLILNSTDPNPEFRPKIMIDYVSDRLALGASFHTSDVHRAGVGSVNLFNGALTFEHTDVSAAGNGLPFDISHVYMSKLKGKEYDFETFGAQEKVLTPNFRMGKGWKLNLQQYLFKEDKPSEKTIATYLDGEGSIHLFEEKYYYEQNGTKRFVKSEDCIENEDETFSITIKKDDTETTYPVIKSYLTESGLRLCFDPNRTALIKQEEQQPQQINNYIFYKNERVAVEPNDTLQTCKFTRYYTKMERAWEYNHSGGVRTFIYFYAAKDVFLDSTDGLFKLKDKPETVVLVENVTYCIQKNNSGERYISVTEYRTEGNQTGTYQYSYQVGLQILTEYIYADGEKIKTTYLFNTEEFMSLKSEIADIQSYIDELYAAKSRYTREKDALTNPSELELSIIAAQKAYKDKAAEIDALGLACENAALSTRKSLLDINSQLSEKNKVLIELGEKIQQEEIDDLRDQMSHLDANYGFFDSAKTKNEKQWRFGRDWNFLDNGVKNGESAQRINKEIRDLQARAEQENTEYESISISNQEKSAELTRALKLKEAEFIKLQEVQNAENLEEQVKILEEEIASLQDKLAKILEIKTQKDKEMEVLVEQEKQKALDFIVDESNHLLGFDYYGKMVEISDGFGNTVKIDYEGDKIASVVKNEEEPILFAYEGDRLAKVLDSRLRMTSFQYDADGLLVKIVYPDNQKETPDGVCDNKKTEFCYNASNELEEVKDQSGYAVKYGYNDFQEVSLVEERSYTEEISKDCFAPLAVPEVGGYVSIVYNSFKSTTVKDDRDIALTYVFDNAGRAVNVYQDEQFVSTDKLNVTNAVALNYSGRRKAYQTSVLQSAVNYARNPSFEVGTDEWTDVSDEASLYCLSETNAFVNGGKSLKIEGLPQASRYARQVVLADALPQGRNLVFSAWAKADSAFIRSDRKSGFGDDVFENYNIDSFDDYKRNRKFGIRVELQYAGYPLETMETTFDWYNTAWQFTALPIRLLTDRTLEHIVLYLDYSNNVNSVLFDHVQLIEGIGNYQEFYEDGKLRYSTDGLVDTFFPEYQNGVPTHAVYVDADGGRYSTEYTFNANKQIVRAVGSNGIVTENYYKQDGALGKSVVYHKDDPSNKFYSESRYDDAGKKIGEVDPRGEVNNETLLSTCNYISGTDLIKERVNADGKKISYGYDYANDNRLSVSQSCCGEENSNLYAYRNGYLTSVSNDAAEYLFGYDGFGRDKFVKIGGKEQVRYSYTDLADHAGHVATATLANGEVLESFCDKLGNLAKTTYRNSSAAEPKILAQNHYDADGVLQSMEDGETGLTHSFEYDNYGKKTLQKYTKDAIEVKTAYAYDKKENLVKQTISIGAEEFEYNYEYEKALQARLQKTVLPNGMSSSETTDKLGRTYESVMTDSSNKELQREYSYYLKYKDHATNMLSAVRYGVNGNLTECTKYSYDKMGNIIGVTENGKRKYRYAYDELNRLQREDNRELGKTWLYEYDNNGNILTKTTSDYTETENPHGEVQSYVYSVGNRKDQLTEINGQTCTYDDFGNPIKYRDQRLEFAYGRQLISFNSNTYKYNASGIRIQKTVENTVTNYTVEDGRIIRETTPTQTLDYFYDAKGLASIQINNKSYLVRKNATKDVTHIYTLDGELQARYAYDAWGNHVVYDATGNKLYDSRNGEAAQNDNGVAKGGTTVGQSAHASPVSNTEGTTETNIGLLNPFRYRSYYYDTETGLYYLQSRYYDPEIGRFISADDVSYLDPETLNGLNLYAYCLNNPVMNYDPTGHAFISILIAIGLGTLIGGVIGGGFELVAQVVAGNGFDWRKIGLAALGGAVAGIISAIPIGGWVGALAFGGISSVAGGLITGSVNSWDTALLAFGIGALANVAAYGISNKFANIKAGKIFNQGNKAKSLAVQQLQGSKFNMGSQALKGSFRNAFKQTTQNEIQKLLLNASPWFRYGIYSAIFSSTLSGWY